MHVCTAHHIIRYNQEWGKKQTNINDCQTRGGWWLVVSFQTVFLAQNAEALTLNLKQALHVCTRVPFSRKEEELILLNTLPT